jgi:hypothetical protein
LRSLGASYHCEVPSHHDDPPHESDSVALDGVAHGNSTSGSQVSTSLAAKPAHPSTFSPKESSPLDQLGLSPHDLVGLDPHEVRARELEHLKMHARAHWVRQCGTSLAAVGGTRTCKQRSCPGCAATIAYRNAMKVRARLLAMKNPREVFVAFRSSGIKHEHLTAAVIGLRAGIRGLRAKCLGPAVPAGAGAIEPKLLDDNSAFGVHSHMALDIPEPIDEGAATDAWMELTKVDGSVRGQIQWRQPINSATGFAVYGTKSDDWSLRPGHAPVELLETVLKGMHGRRLLIAWPRSVPFSG